jgi:hypothetical protein
VRTFEQWSDFLRGMPPEDLPSYKTWKGNVEGLIANLAEQYAKADVELEAEVARLDALSPKEYAESFFREEFDEMREHGRWGEYEQGYYAAMLKCAVCLAGIGDPPIAGIGPSRTENAFRHVEEKILGERE